MHSGKAQYDVLDVAAVHADLKYLDYGFFRDCNDWIMQIKFSDAKGPYSAHVGLPETIPVSKKELKPERITKQIDMACVKAHQSRMPAGVMGRKAA